MSIRIELSFKTSISRLAGNSYGLEIYNSQVKDLLNLKDKNIIVIPNHIEDIAISFVQGFTAPIFESISKETFFDHVEIEASDKVKNKFMKAVFF